MDSLMFKNILETTTLPYARKNLRRGWIYQMDNEPKHKSKLVTQFLNDNRIRLLEWPSQSPDINPIENLWNELRRRVKVRKQKNRDKLFFPKEQSSFEINY